LTGEHFDVLIVGAGLSGIGAACRLRTRCPGSSFAILEARDDLGGTWDLFRYPGVRSDSEMFTLSYSFRPWTHAAAIAGGRTILTYIRDTAREFGVDRRIRFGHKVRAAAWSSAEARWTLDVEAGPEQRPGQLTCGFLIVCAGYYSYEGGYRPEFPGLERFGGRIVDPQRWTDDVDYVGKRVLVIGSGATAVTIVPALARRAAHVVMLQRSPTYVIERASRDGVADALRAALPERLAFRLARWKNIVVGAAFYRFCRRFPRAARWLLLARTRDAMGASVDAAKHFTPRYQPWDQRLCQAPDGDLFRALRGGRASIVTDTITTFTASGVALASGETIDADIAVAATGLELQPLGGIRLSVDGAAIEPGETTVFKGAMLSGVPNLVFVFGYTAAAWTLKADLVSLFACRLINRLKRSGFRRCMPRASDPSMAKRPLVDFSSGAYRRAAAKLPKQGTDGPWASRQSYWRDFLALRFAPLRSGGLRFCDPAPAAAARRNRGAASAPQTPSAAR
jgi:cation diffusion facilitator CzcD-associated flavoprotein CzcO